MLATLLLPLLALTTTLACPDHSYSVHSLARRAEPTKTQWTYEASYDWGRLSEDYSLCQAGTQQAPIPLLLTQGLSLNHVPTFHYNRNVSGVFLNWGYGPAMTLAHSEGDYTSLPSFTFEENGKDETVYMTGWHIHSPADHSVQGDRSKAEMHFVHVTAEGKPRAVLAFRVDPGNANSTFFEEMPDYFSFRHLDGRINATMNPRLALDEVNRFNEFWTYKGSLTSPPCTEGIRFFIARNILFVGNGQMQDILRNSIYSARAEQEVWLHQINV